MAKHLFVTVNSTMPLCAGDTLRIYGLGRLHVVIGLSAVD